MIKKKQINDIKRSLLEIKNELNLQEWKIKVIAMDKDDDEKIFADNKILVRYRESEIRIYPHFFNQDEDEQYHTLVHEMCHIITHSLVDVIWDLKSGKMIHSESIIDILEATTEKIARIYNV